MDRRRMRLRRSASAMMSAGCLTVGLAVAPGALLAACAPCAPKTRRSAQANPCAARNPCAAKKAAKGPCSAANPCAAKALKRPANYAPYRGTPADLIATGKALFSDTKLSSNGMSCNTCHNDYNAYQPTFAKPYPHAVAMATGMGFKQVHADEMVQLCMVQPMAAKPLAWDSRELAALTAYVVDLQKGYKPKAAGTNPCAAKNLCAAKKACGPKAACAPKAACGARNPCASKNTAASKPACAPRNPCAAKR